MRSEVPAGLADLSVQPGAGGVGSGTPGTFDHDIVVAFCQIQKHQCLGQFNARWHSLKLGHNDNINNFGTFWSRGARQAAATGNSSSRKGQMQGRGRARVSGLESSLSAIANSPPWEQAPVPSGGTLLPCAHLLVNITRHPRTAKSLSNSEKENPEKNPRAGGCWVAPVIPWAGPDPPVYLGCRRGRGRGSSGRRGHRLRSCPWHSQVVCCSRAFSCIFLML